MDELKKICETLVSRVNAEIANGLENVDTMEMGQVMDMIKDLKEAMYYGKITEAMEESERREAPAEGERMYYGRGRRMYREMPEQDRDMDLSSGRMYYTEQNGGNMHDKRMGRSGMKRVRYYEAKETGDTADKMTAIDEYTHTLSEDIMEMIMDANPNEKNLMKQKLSTIIAKIG